jgi:hypothetical protein
VAGKTGPGANEAVGIIGVEASTTLYSFTPTQLTLLLDGDRDI